ncbi:MAG: fumarylacetoacetate hydrolase family protein, partial [Elusimicrobia bacterium]|nr:fumarylacetoacetate hydrolase family protein [Elusimicrobiota bacterium]
GILRRGGVVDLDAIEFLPPLGQNGKIICLGGNYPAHAKEAGLKAPSHPTIFARFPSSLVGHRAKLIRPRVSTRFDYEGELVAVIGKRGRHIPEGKALEYVAGYSIFNDASVRDYQLETPQWTVGKNFDGTGALGPCFVTADEVPPGGSGLRLETRLNGQVVQTGRTSEMTYGVANTIAFLSQAMTLDPGDLLVMGTPPGVGMARKPPLYMKAGDVCEVEIEGLGVLSNTVADEA